MGFVKQPGVYVILCKVHRSFQFELVKYFRVRFEVIAVGRGWLLG